MNQSYTYHTKKLAKNIDLLYKARELLDKESLKTINFSYIHSYLHYANITWASTYFTNLKAVLYQQKHTAKAIFTEDILTHSRPPLQLLNALNTNKFISSCWLYVQISKKSNTKNIFEKRNHKYLTQFSEVNFKYKKLSLTSTKYSISAKGKKSLKWTFYQERKKNTTPFHSPGKS